MTLLSVIVFFPDYLTKFYLSSLPKRKTFKLYRVKLTWVKLTEAQEGEKDFVSSNIWSYFSEKVLFKVMKEFGDAIIENNIAHLWGR